MGKCCLGLLVGSWDLRMLENHIFAWFLKADVVNYEQKYVNFEGKLVPGPPLGNLPDAQYMRSARVTMYSCFVTKTYYSQKKNRMSDFRPKSDIRFLTPISSNNIEKTCKQQQVMSQSRICLQTSLRHVYVCRHLRITHVWNLQKRIVKRTLFDSGRVRDKLNYERRLHLKILSNILHGLWRPRWVTRCRKMSVWEVVSPIPEHKSRTIISSGTREARPHWF